jgi:hypothetical protein
MSQKIAPIRWSIEWAAKEFRVNPRTLRAKLSQQGILPGEDKQYSTEQITAAIYGDLHTERLRLVRAQRERIQQQIDENSGRLVDSDRFFLEYSGIFSAIRQHVLASDLSDAEKAGLLAELRNDVLYAKPVEAEEAK